MSCEEFESFWTAYDRILCVGDNSPDQSYSIRRPANHNHILPGLYSNDLPKIFRLKRAGWKPCTTWKMNSSGGYAAWPSLWQWQDPVHGIPVFTRDAYEKVSGKHLMRPNDPP